MVGLLSGRLPICPAKVGGGAKGEGGAALLEAGFAPLERSVKFIVRRDKLGIEADLVKVDLSLLVELRLGCGEGALFGTLD